MIRIAPPMKDSSQAKKYFFPDRSGFESDYYFMDQAQGIWTGKLAERMGLSGVIQQRHFDRMCDHRHPFMDEPFTARHNLGRRVGTDISFSCTKSVSMLALMTKDERIITLLRNAATETLGLMEEHAGTRVRRNKQNMTKVTGEWASAMFIHTTARPAKDGVAPDCQLHLHAFTFNATVSDENFSKRKALDLTYVYHDLPFYQAVFHSIVAKGIEQLGYGIERRGIQPVAYEVKAITRQMIWKFSNRTKQIMAEIKRLGIGDPKIMDRMAEYTRLPKNESEWSPTALMKSWWGRLDADETRRLETANHWGQVPGVSPVQAVDAAIEHCFTRQSVVQDRRLLEYALRRGVGSVTLEQVQEELERRDWWSKTDEHGRRLVTTPEMAALEKTLLERVRAGRGKHKPLGVLGDGRTQNGITLDEYQYKAASKLLDSTDWVSVLIGKAGVGKTTLMHAVKDGIEASKKRVIALAPSAEASRGVQREEGFSNAETVAAFLDSKELQAKARGQVIWCDEASLLGVKDMDKLMKTAAKLKARLIYSGDTGQHRAVNAGDSLRLLLEHGGIKPVRLSNIRRQQSKQYRQVVKYVSEGKMAKAWEGLEKMNAIVDMDNPRHRYHELARDYMTALADGDSVLAVAPTHAEGKKVTEHIRQHMKVHGLVAGPEREVMFHRNLHYTDDQKKNPAAYEPGQYVFFHKSAPGIQSGSRFLVVGVKNDRVMVKPHGFTLTTLPRKYADRFSVYRPESIQVAKGDVLRVTQNTHTVDRKTRLNNGGMYRCVGHDRFGNMRVEVHRPGKIKLRKSKRLTIAKDNGYINHGVCTTSPAAQAKSVDVTLGAIGPESLVAASQNQFYVTVSRGKKKVKLYVDDVDRVKAVLAGSEQRMLATELIKSRSNREKMVQSRWLRTLKTMGTWKTRRGAPADRPRKLERRKPGHNRGRMFAHKRRGMSYER